MQPETDLPKSLVTGNDCVKIVDRFAVADIVRLYKQQENVDVSGYLLSGDTMSI